MIVLAVHSTSPSLGIAVAEDGRILGEKTFAPGREHLERLAPAIRDLIGEFGITPREIDGLGVAKGPGSFSGIRVGMATVKGMALALEKPVVGISSLEILAWQTLRDGATGAAVVDAKRGEIYAAIYERQGEQVRLTHGPLLISGDELKSLVSQSAQPVVLCCADTLAEELARSIPRLVTSPASVSPAAACSLIAWERLRSGSADDPHGLAPFYVRRSDAEEKKGGLAVGGGTFLQKSPSPVPPLQKTPQ